MSEKTFGQTLVGLDFNPSGDDKVTKAKQLCAELTDLLIDHVEGTQVTQLKSVMIDAAVMKILEAQMFVVKVLTFKQEEQEEA